MPTKIIGSATWVKYMDKIKAVNSRTNLNLGILLTFSKRNAQINMKEVTLSGTNQGKGCMKYFVPLNAFSETIANKLL